jgi:branched-chain amino acid transport system substrate-binding protein
MPSTSHECNVGIENEGVRMTVTRKNLYFGTIALVVSMLIACAPVRPAAPQAAQPSGTITLASSMPRTGAAKTQTDSIANAIRMAIAEVNGRVGSATINYVDMDDASVVKGDWDGATEAANANLAINDPDVMVYLGTLNSGAAAISIPILCKAGLAMISPANSYPGLTKALPSGTKPEEPDLYYGGCARNYVRVVPTDELQGAVAARWSRDLGASRVYILDDGDLYGQGIVSFYALAAPGIGLTIVGGPESIDPKATDYRALAQKIRASNPDLVYFGGTAENNAGKLWQDLRATLDPKTKLMGPDGIYGPAFLVGAGSAAEDTFVTFGGVPATRLSGRGAEWYTTYKQRFGEEPYAYTAYGYEVARVALDAIQRAGRKDRAAIRDALFATRDYDGVLGRWSFTETGDTSLSTMSGRQIKNGGYDDANAVLLKAPD